METQPIASSARALRHMFLRDLVLHASIGVHPHEHADATAGADQRRSRRRGRWRTGLVAPAGRARRAGARGGLREAGRRGAWHRHVGHVRLVETLAERIAEACLRIGGSTSHACGWRSLTSSRMQHQPAWRSSAAKATCPRPEGGAQGQQWDGGMC